MKYFHKNTLLKLAAFSLLLITALIIHSCRKDSKQSAAPTTVNIAVEQAKAWYESAYPVVANAGTSHQTTNSISNTAFDFSQHTQPDWKHTASYAKLGKNVIEMPIDSTAQFNFSLKNIAAASYYDKKYTRTYFLMMNDGKNYEAYVMTLIADPAYVKNDLTKLTHNTYRKLDADFSGVILYFTPKGEYLNGYAYQNGQLMGTPAATTQTTQSTTGSKLKTNVAAPTQDCTDWYLITYDKQTGEILNTEYLYTICTDGTDNNGGGSSPAPPTPKCTPPTDVESTGHLTINVAAPPPGGGDGSGGPPPPSEPCPTVVPIKVTDKLTDSCLIAVLNKLTNSDLNGEIAHIINDVFGSNDQVNITFIQNNDPNGAPAQTIGPAPVNGIFNATITLNLAQLSSASQEYKAIIMVHEVLHAYMDYNNQYTTQLAQHEQMAEKWVNDMRNFLKQIYPSIKDTDANDIILDGFNDVFTQQPAYWNDLVSSVYSTNNVDIELTSDNYKKGYAGYGTPCKN